MHRIVVTTEELSSASIILNREETHHLLNVKRVTPNETIELIDGRGHCVKACFIGKDQGKAMLKILPETLQFLHKPSPNIFLVQAIPKHPRMDLIIEKSVELGIQGIFPIITRNTIVKLSNYEFEERVKRWRKKIQEAGKQSGVLWLPEIFKLSSLGEILSLIKGENCTVLVGALKKGIPMLFDEVLKLKALSPLPEKIYLFIGPEGDFIDEELEVVATAGGAFVQFGTPILRTDTAAIFGLSVLVSAFPRQFL